MATSEKEIEGWIDLNSDGNKNQNKYWKMLNPIIFKAIMC